MLVRKNSAIQAPNNPSTKFLNRSQYSDRQSVDSANMDQDLCIGLIAEPFHAIYWTQLRTELFRHSTGRERP
jgi:hypothetical protein